MNALVSAAAFDDKIALSDIDSAIPDGIPQPSLWKVAAIPTRMRKISRKGIILPDDTVDANLWTHQLYKIVAIGKQVYRGPAYSNYDISDDEMPKVGELWLIDPRQPRRYVFKGHTIVILNDDQLLSRVDPAQVGYLKFNGMELA